MLPVLEAGHRILYTVSPRLKREGDEDEGGGEALFTDVFRLLARPLASASLAMSERGRLPAEGALMLAREKKPSRRKRDTQRKGTPKQSKTH